LRALFIGRFQPLHLGHIHALNQAISIFGDVVVAIGSSEKHDIPENPFTFEERKEMIKRCIQDVDIIGIEDTPDDQGWVENLLKKVDFDVVVSGSGWVKKCIFKFKRVLKPEFLEPNTYSATVIRGRMAKGERWEDLVPEVVADYIKEIHGDERVKRLMQEP
jgi:nicotinamide-nucleotide adenylyltransferase